MQNSSFLNKRQKTFLSEINTYINGSIFSKYDLFLSLVFPRVQYRRYAKRIIKKMKDMQIFLPSMNLKKKNIKIKSYRGRNLSVQKMISYINENLKEDLIGAYVHGSLGTYEEISYSDFDSLVILKNEVFETPERLIKVALKLNEARSIMFEFDPLQHHGWFVLTESDLEYYPEYYFPLDLFRYAKSLIPDKGLELNIRVPATSCNNVYPFYALSENIISQCKNRNYPKNMYQLKHLLSRFILLPALYVQARDKKGIYKKFSFDLAKSDFSKAEWLIVDQASQLRKKWDYDISPFWIWISKRPYPVLIFIKKFFSSPIPFEVKKNLTEDFYQRMENIATSMQKRIKEK